YASACRSSTVPFSLSRHGALPDLPSFPTRRSSDLLVRAAAVGRGLVRAVPREARAVRPPRVVLPRRAELHRVRPRRQVLVVEGRSEEHTSELQSRENLVCRLLLEKKKRMTSSY